MVTPHSFATACWIAKVLSAGPPPPGPSIALSLSRSASRATSTVISRCLSDA